jgi:genome maintenance exonuclease 1
METIVDFKQANRPKQRDWIEDYFLQISAYAMAHNYVYGSNIRQGIIMIVTPDLYFQEYRFQDADLRKYQHQFLKRLDEYYKLKYDEKEQANIQTEDLMKEFEEEAAKLDKARKGDMAKKLW